MELTYMPKNIFNKFNLLFINVVLLLTSVNVHAGNEKYKISDEAVKKAIIQSNKYEQCAYPEIKAANGDAKKLEELYAKLENDFSFEFVQLQIVELIKMDLAKEIGEDNVNLMFSDPDSMKYFEETLEKLNHSDPIEPETASEVAYCASIQNSMARLKLFELKAKLREERRKEKLAE